MNTNAPPSPLIDITNTSPQDWKYVSEGGAAIVFSYTGDPINNPYCNGTVLRLRKIASAQRHATLASDTTMVSGISGHSPFCQQEESNESNDPMIEFQHKVIERLIPSKYLPRLTAVRVERAWLQDLADLRDSDRPSDRRHKDHIDVARRRAVLATDLVGGNALAVEIKPKWAFLPSPTHLSPATLLIKTKTCRFCMHTHYRSRNNGAIPLKYCPLDLFSGNEMRIEKAVRDLLDGWFDSNGFVNNLRIFRHGMMVKPDDLPSTDLVALRETFLSIMPLLLFHTPILHTLAKLQRSLDVLDIEGLSKLWALSYLQSPFDTPSEGIPPIGSTSPQPTISDWTEFVDEYLFPDQNFYHTHPKASDLRYYLLAYLLSATFKDCSIILGINPDGDSRIAGEMKANSIALIDLDPKSIGKLSGWERLDRDIVESYNDIQTMHCMDGWKDD